jgi:hypothetical protein
MNLIGQAYNVHKDMNLIGQAYNVQHNKHNYRLNFFNFLKGEKIHINLNLTDENLNRILEIFQLYSEN